MAGVDRIDVEGSHNIDYTPEALEAGERLKDAIDAFAAGKQALLGFAHQNSKYPFEYIFWNGTAVTLIPQGPVYATPRSPDLELPMYYEAGDTFETTQPISLTNFDIEQVDEDGKVWVHGRSLGMNSDGTGKFLSFYFAPRDHLIAVELPR